MPSSPVPSSIARLRGKGGRYHHGNLRGALIVAAAGLLETEGEAGLTLRALADRAGVSRAAPYRHFADKEALLATLAGEGFRVLDREMERAAAMETTAPGRLRAMARAYVAFAQRYHRMFRLMFAGAADPEGRGSGQLRRRLSDAVAGMGSATDGMTAMTAWSLIHGLAALALDSPVVAEAARAPNVDGVVDLLIGGIG